MYLKSAETKKESRQGWDPTFICIFSSTKAWIFYFVFGRAVIPTLSGTFWNNKEANEEGATVNGEYLKALKGIDSNQNTNQKNPELPPCKVWGKIQTKQIVFEKRKTKPV